MKSLKVKVPLKPAGDQPKAIERLVEGVNRGHKFQTLLGITGSGKSATIAWTIEGVNRPTLILAPNKSLAAQLASEMKEFFPENRVEFFVSYYDYYQPEAYVPQKDLFIEKDAKINEEIDRMRHSATTSLLSRRDVIVVASVSAIYGLGSPIEYLSKMLALKVGQETSIREILRRLVDLQYTRDELDVSRGTFRLQGDILEIHPAYDETVYRISFFGDTLETIRKVDLLHGEILEELSELSIFPATHYVASDEVLKKAISQIEKELVDQVRYFEKAGRLLEAQRIKMRTEHDLEMIQELGYCTGIENYSRHLDGRKPGETPFCLLDYFPSDYLVVIDESHVTIPQLHGQYAGDRSRKETLVEFGFRLPCALDNRPLQFDEFMAKVNQVIFMSATPSDYELSVSSNVVEQIVRPTGLLDPEVIVKPTKHQIDDLLAEIQEVIASNNRVLITTLTKSMAEELTEYLCEAGYRARYMHSDINTIDRIELTRDLRLGRYDILVGINLLREGLDLPEVSLVAILDADKEGFLRSSTSLIQTIGRAARNVNGRVILYADRITAAMRKAIDETRRRRAIQIDFNKKHGIKPETIQKTVSDLLAELKPRLETQVRAGRYRKVSDLNPMAGRKVTFNKRLYSLPIEIERDLNQLDIKLLTAEEFNSLVSRLENVMQKASKELKFEVAARLRDEIRSLEQEYFWLNAAGNLE